MKTFITFWKYFLFLLVVWVWFFSLPVDTTASPLLFSQIQEYVEEEWMWQLEVAYHKLKIASKTHDNYYVRSRVHELLWRFLLLNENQP